MQSAPWSAPWSALWSAQWAGYRPSEFAPLIRKRLLHILGTHFAVPSLVESAADLAVRTGKSEQWILERTGVANRHTSDETVDPAQLAAEACRPLLDQFGPVDLILTAGSVHRQLLPDLSVFVQRELDLAPTPCFSLNATCLSFLVAMKVAADMLAAGSYRRILLCTAELASRGRNFREPESAALLGDGAAAMIVEAAGTGGVGFEHFAMQTWSDGVELAEVRGGGIWRRPDDRRTTDDDHLFHMEGERLLRNVAPKLRRFLKTFFAQAKVDADQVALVVPHQPSGPGLQMLSRLGFAPDRVVNIVADYGNCVAASIPMALAIAQRDGRLHRGDRLLLLGTAAGVSIGGALLRW